MTACKRVSIKYKAFHRMTVSVCAFIITLSTLRLASAVVVDNDVDDNVLLLLLLLL